MTVPLVFSNVALDSGLRASGFGRWQPRVRWLPQSQILLWAIREGSPRALQTSECHELLNPTRTSCLILAQRQPGKLASGRIYIRSPQCCVVKQNLFLFYIEVSEMVQLHTRLDKRNLPLANTPLEKVYLFTSMIPPKLNLPQEGWSEVPTQRLCKTELILLATPRASSR